MRICLILICLTAFACGSRYTVADYKAAEEMVQTATNELADAQEKLESLKAQKASDSPEVEAAEKLVAEKREKVRQAEDHMSKVDVF